MLLNNNQNTYHVHAIRMIAYAWLRYPRFFLKFTYLPWSITNLYCIRDNFVVNTSTSLFFCNLTLIYIPPKTPYSEVPRESSTVSCILFSVFCSEWGVGCRNSCRRDFNDVFVASKHGHLDTRIMFNFQSVLK